MTIKTIKAAIEDGRREWSVEEHQIDDAQESWDELDTLADRALEALDCHDYAAAAEHVDAMAAVCAEWGDAGDLPAARDTLRALADVVRA
jgi:hypothetical protein